MLRKVGAGVQERQQGSGTCWVVGGGLVQVEACAGMLKWRPRFAAMHAIHDINEK